MATTLLTPQLVVMPPNKLYRRARCWRTFEKLFAPIERQGGDLIWEPWDVPKDSDHRFWWTVLDPMTSGQLYLTPGFRFVNRLGYVQCRNSWGGEDTGHPEYLY